VSARDPDRRGSVSTDSRAFVTGVLESVSASGDPQNVPEGLLPIVYPELRQLAASYLRREPAGHTLQATELVHEAYLKLVDQTRVDWRGRTHFFAVAANAMRRILVDHARRRGRIKRGSGRRPITLDDAIGVLRDPAFSVEDLIALDDALADLARADPRQARVVELRTFTGLTVGEVAAALGVSKRTVEGDWTHAMAWLRRRLDLG
jgi:RNA polymerase sigma factor (TIGR02999 family)